MRGASVGAIGKMGGFGHLGIGHGIFGKLLLIGLLSRLGFHGVMGTVGLIVIGLIVLGVILFIVYRQRIL